MQESGGDKKQNHLGLAMDKGAPQTGRIPDFLHSGNGTL